MLSKVDRLSPVQSSIFVKFVRIFCTFDAKCIRTTPGGWRAWPGWLDETIGKGRKGQLNFQFWSPNHLDLSDPAVPQSTQDHSSQLETQGLSKWIEPARIRSVLEIAARACPILLLLILFWSQQALFWSQQALFWSPQALFWRPQALFWSQLAVFWSQQALSWSPTRAFEKAFGLLPKAFFRRPKAFFRRPKAF